VLTAKKARWYQAASFHDSASGCELEVLKRVDFNYNAARRSRPDAAITEDLIEVSPTDPFEDTLESLVARDAWALFA
jgi:hypothetical protein